MEEKRFVSYDSACRTICVSATIWDDAKFYKQKHKAVEVVALRIAYFDKFRWTLAITVPPEGNLSHGHFYGIDDYFTQTTKLVNVLKELDLI